VKKNLKAFRILLKRNILQECKVKSHLHLFRILELHYDQLKTSLGGKQLTLVPYVLQQHPLLLQPPCHLEEQKLGGLLQK